MNAEPVQQAKSGRSTSSWFFLDEEHGIECLEPFADMISSVSVADAPQMKDEMVEFLVQCRQLGIETYKIVSGKASALDRADKARATMDGFLAYCNELGFDGIDLDFEHLDASLQDKYMAFVRELAQELHAAGKKLSICVGYYPQMYEDPPEKYFYDPKGLNETCDVVRVMCYDLYFAGPEAEGIGPTATKPWAREAMTFWLKYVDREKLIMALPAYSNDFDLTPGASGIQQYGCPRPEGPDDEQLLRDLAKGPSDLPSIKEGTEIEHTWLAYERLHSYRYVDDKGRLHHFFATDADSTAALLEAAAELGIDCVGFWCRRYVTPGMWKAVRDWQQQGQ